MKFGAGTYFEPRPPLIVASEQSPEPRRGGLDSAQDALLLRLKLGLGQHALRLQLSELLELRQLVAHRVLRGGLRLVRRLLLVCGLLRVLLLVLRRPAPGLPAGYAVGHGGGGTRYRGGKRDSAE